MNQVDNKLPEIDTTNMRYATLELEMNKILTALECKTEVNDTEEKTIDYLYIKLSVINSKIMQLKLDSVKAKQIVSHMEKRESLYSTRIELLEKYIQNEAHTKERNRLRRSHRSFMHDGDDRTSSHFHPEYYGIYERDDHHDGHDGHDDHDDHHDNYIDPDDLTQIGKKNYIYSNPQTLESAEIEGVESIEDDNVRSGMEFDTRNLTNNVEVFDVYEPKRGYESSILTPVENITDFMGLERKINITKKRGD